MTELTAEKLAKVYVKIREARRELKKKDDALEAQLKQVAAELLNICKEQGAATIRTEHGTISRRVTKRYWTNDWESFFKFIKDQDAFNLVQQRINTTNMQQFLEEHPELHPPGLNADVEQTVVITKR